MPTHPPAPAPATDPARRPVLVVLPMLGDPGALLDAVADLASRWPAAVDAQLVVPCRPLDRRDTALLGGLGSEVALQPVDVPGAGFGDLVARAASAGAGCLVVLDPAALPDTSALHALAEGRTAPGGLVVDAALFDAVPVLSAARDLGSLAALVALQTTAAPARRPRAGRRDRRTPGVLVSAALIVKDEQRALPGCLAALRGVVDELVVCDTGSTDRTVEIALAFGARVVREAWQDDFAAARNTVLAACRGAWVLSVDADEQLHAGAREDLRRQLRETAGDALTVPVRSRSDDAGTASFEHQAGRLFRRGRLRWTGAVHETLVDPRTGRPPVYLPSSGLLLVHDGYLDRVYAERGKSTRNLQLAEKDHARATAAGDPRLWKTAYELARALSRHAEDDPRLEPLLRQALALMPLGLAHLRCDALVRLGTALAAQDRREEAEQAARAAVSTSHADPAAVLLLGQLLAVDGRHAEALAALDSPCDAPGDASALRDLGKEQVDLPLLRARLLQRLDRPAEAAEVLLALAERHLPSMDWPLAHALLTGSALAGLAARAPEQALAALDGLPPAERDALSAALREHGVDAAAYAPDVLHARRLEQALAGSDPDAVAGAALALEDTDLAQALALWHAVPATGQVQAARARCLLQLGRVDEAVDAVDGLDAAGLAPADLLVVVAVAAAAGDPGTAQALLDGLPDQLPDGLRASASGLARTLGLDLPDRVDRVAIGG